LLEFFLIFFKASLITFAGMGSVPVLQQDLVQFRGWTTDDQIAKALAVSRLSPGPNGMYVVSLGYMMLGWAGAVVALLASVLPPLVVLPLAPIVRRTMHLPWVNGLMRGIGLGSAGLLLVVGYGIIFPSGLTALSSATLLNLGLGALGMVLTWTGRVHPVVVIGLAGLAGIGLSTFGL
jgi:chromate transporter